MKQANWRRKRSPASAIVIQQFLVPNYQSITGKQPASQRTELLLGVTVVLLSNHRSRMPKLTDGASPLMLVSRYRWKSVSLPKLKNAHRHTDFSLWTRPLVREKYSHPVNDNRNPLILANGQKLFQKIETSLAVPDSVTTHPPAQCFEQWDVRIGEQPIPISE